MRVIEERDSRALVTWELAFEAARQALISAARDGVLFPAVVAHTDASGNRFSIKSGVIDGVAGLKIGSFWPGNATQGLPRHSSLILLFDMASGRIDTVIEASAANAFRTAAADAVAAQALARRDARTLAVFGAGNQAFHEVVALTKVRDIARVLVVSRNASSVRSFIDKLKSEGIDAIAADAYSACSSADIIVTATPAREPLFAADWIRPGTHIAAMGADGPGKQELPGELLQRAALFCDSSDQSLEIGEFQSIAATIRRGEATLTPIGAVLAGAHPGRRSDDEITIFDSSGIALQDLALARCIASRLDTLDDQHA